MFLTAVPNLQDDFRKFPSRKYARQPGKQNGINPPRSENGRITERLKEMLCLLSVALFPGEISHVWHAPQ
jgi:hypothetical protein